MFRRIIYEDWIQIVPILAFALTFAVFAYFFFRAIRMQRSEADRMGNLPLSDD